MHDLPFSYYLASAVRTHSIGKEIGMARPDFVIPSRFAG